jgi:hypothetical protein
MLLFIVAEEKSHTPNIPPFKIEEDVIREKFRKKYQNVWRSRSQICNYLYLNW